MAATPGGMKRFYAILAGVAVVGLGVLLYLTTRPAAETVPANVTVQASDTAGFRGYIKGSPTTSAPSVRPSRPSRCPPSRSV
jgi:hypothetical protein